MTLDFIVAGFLIYLFIRGWTRGLLRTLIGPLSLIVGCLIGFIYYQKSKDLITSLLISFFAPFLLAIAFSMMVKIWHKAVHDKKTPSFLSGLLGSVFSVLWGGIYLALFLVLIAMVPINTPLIKNMKGHVTSSKSYALWKKWTGEKIPDTSIDLKKYVKIIENPALIGQYESTEEFQDLVNDDALKELTSDEEVLEHIRDKNYHELLSNPKMQEILQDEELIKKIFALNRRIMESEHKNEPAGETIETNE